MMAQFEKHDTDSSYISVHRRVHKSVLNIVQPVPIRGIHVRDGRHGDPVRETGLRLCDGHVRPRRLRFQVRPATSVYGGHAPAFWIHPCKYVIKRYVDTEIRPTRPDK